MKKVIKEIVSLVRKAQGLALKIGIPNILQPGLIKEMIMAEILGHDVIYSKHDSDACDRKNKNLKYEYLSCLEGKRGQFDRMFKTPKDKREVSLNRIRRNKAIYLAIFFKDDPLKVKVIYELAIKTVEEETVRQLNRSRNAISHVGFNERWAAANGKVVYPNPRSKG